MDDLQKYNYPYWFMPFVPYIADVRIDNFGNTQVMIGVSLKIPAGEYDWEGVDIDALRDCGLSHLSISKKGFQKVINYKTNEARFDPKLFSHWEIEMDFKNSIHLNEEESNLANRWIQ